MALKYLETYDSKKTVNTYKHALKAFLGNIFGKGQLEDLARKYLSTPRDHKTDLQNFLASINGRPPRTIQMYLSAVRTFLIENEVELPQRFWRSLRRRIKGSMARTMDKVPSNVELRRIVMHMPVNGKALYLTLSSSGMRIGEALQLELDDIDMDDSPPRISIRGEYTKSGDPRVTFISNEAKEHIKEWLKYRDQYLESASKRSRYGKSTEDSRLFPFSLANASFIWRHALEKADLNQRDKSTNRHKIHPHVLRKFFRTKMGAAIPVDVTEALMGHKGYLTDIYRHHSVEDLAKFYKQGEEAVTVFGRIEESAQIKQDVRKLESRIVDLNRKIEEQKTVIEDLSKLMGEKVEAITRKLVEKYLKELYEEEREAMISEQKWREEKQKEPPPPETKKEPPPTEEKTMTDSLDDFYKQL